MNSNKWKEVSVIVRRTLPQWEAYDKSMFITLFYYLLQYYAYLRQIQSD